MSDEIINLNDWYTAGEALARLEANVGRKLDESTPRQLGKDGKVKSIMIGNRRLYFKPDINVYQVEERGQKVARAQRQRGLANKQATKKRTSAKNEPDAGTSFALAI